MQAVDSWCAWRTLLNVMAPMQLSKNFGAKMTVQLSGCPVRLPDTQRVQKRPGRKTGDGEVTRKLPGSALVSRQPPLKGAGRRACIPACAWPRPASRPVPGLTFSLRPRCTYVPACASLLRMAQASLSTGSRSHLLPAPAMYLRPCMRIAPAHGPGQLLDRFPVSSSPCARDVPTSLHAHRSCASLRPRCTYVPVGKKDPGFNPGLVVTVLLGLY